jgi:adenine-specific DNA methylase
MMGPAVRKARGAYYTDPAIARFLVRFAVRGPRDEVLDPCFGEGVFLRSAVNRLRELGGNAAAHVTGIELDARAHLAAQAALASEGLLPRDRLHRADFFARDPTGTGHFHAVVGNPPFIRYQRFSGAQRVLALRRALEAGARLSALTSSWAPFIAHATTFLEPHGRLAMVAPAELCHAAYAKPVLDLLTRRFRSVRVLTFARRLFPELSEDTVLVLADGYGQGGGAIQLVPLSDAGALSGLPTDRLDGVVVSSGGGHAVRLIAYLLPEAARALYGRLGMAPDVKRLGALAAVGIGYVTGSNEFFHLSDSEAGRLRIPPEVLRPAVCRANWLKGLMFRRGDWDHLRRRGHKTFLLALPQTSQVLAGPVAEYVESGARRKIDRAYKCRVRRPWYAVPHVIIPDMFLTYMANARPALVLNRARAVAPNTLLCVRIDAGSPYPAEALAVAWWTSLGALSAEIEGHSLGAGMLKLEPGEAINVRLPMPRALMDRERARRLARDLDRLILRGAVEEALDLGDREILQRDVGVSPGECAQLRAAFHFLKERRRRR